MYFFTNLYTEIKIKMHYLEKVVLTLGIVTQVITLQDDF